MKIATMARQAGVAQTQLREFLELIGHNPPGSDPAQDVLPRIYAESVVAVLKKNRSLVVKSKPRGGSQLSDADLAVLKEHGFGQPNGKEQHEDQTG